MGHGQGTGHSTLQQQRHTESRWKATGIATVARQRLRAAERLELTSVIDRLWRRFLERLDTIYDTC
jgi:hypothetical protein